MHSRFFNENPFLLLHKMVPLHQSSRLMKRTNNLSETLQISIAVLNDPRTIAQVPNKCRIIEIIIREVMGGVSRELVRGYVSFMALVALLNDEIAGALNDFKDAVLERDPHSKWQPTEENKDQARVDAIIKFVLARVELSLSPSGATRMTLIHQSAVVGLNLDTKLQRLMSLATATATATAHAFDAPTPTSTCGNVAGASVASDKDDCL